MPLSDSSSVIVSYFVYIIQKPGVALAPRISGKNKSAGWRSDPAILQFLKYGAIPYCFF
jgi:hypothetical protein